MAKTKKIQKIEARSAAQLTTPHPSLLLALTGFCTKHGVLVEHVVRAFARDKNVARAISSEVLSFQELTLAEQGRARLSGPTLLVRYERAVSRYVELRPYKRNQMPALAPFVGCFNANRRAGKGEISDGSFGRPVHGDGRYQSGHYDETRVRD